MPLHLTAHPAAVDALAHLRNRATPPGVFRAQLNRLAALVVADATAAAPTTAGFVDGPLADCVPVARATAPVFVPVLRAGVGMLDGALAVWPDAGVSFVGIARDETTLAAGVYLDRVGDIAGADVVVLDPMLATGGSLLATLTTLAAHGQPRSVAVAGVVCTPDGAAAVTAAHPDVALHFAACDPRLDDRGYILPGLGDAGDRTCGR
jgi:uracil phosphoribosyltransferase